MIAHPGNVDEMMKSAFTPHGPSANIYWNLYKSNFPKIYTIFRNISKLPASSSSLERIFSEISRKVGKDRTSFRCETLVALQQGSTQALKFMDKITEFKNKECN